MSTQKERTDQSKLTPSEPSAHGYQPGDEELNEGSQPRDPAQGGDVPPVEATPEA